MNGKPMTLADMDALVEAWAATPEGEADLDQMAVAGRRAQEQVARDARVSPEDLRRVIGPPGTKPLF